MKSKVLTGLLIGVFFFSLLGLAVHIFPELLPAKVKPADGYAPSRTGRYEKVAEVSLGKVEIRGYQQMGSTPGLVRIAPVGEKIVVGTENGDVLMLDWQGNRLWQRQIGLGKISALEFSRDGRTVFIGENSQQGAVICVDAASGAERWRRASAEELGVDIRQKTFPGIMYMTDDAKGNLYAVALRSVRQAGGQTEYFSRIYRFDPQGNVELLPRDQNMDVWVSCISVDEAGRELVFATSDYAPGRARRYAHNIYALETGTAKELWHADIPTIAPYERTNMRFGPEISPDAGAVAGIASDGRAFFFAGTGQLQWTRSLSHPQKVQGIYVNATGLHVRHLGEYVAFTTGNTYNRANWQLSTPVEHPQSNNVFLFDRTGHLVKRRKMGGMLEHMATSRNELAVAVGRNIRSKDPGVHGLALLSVPELDLLDMLPTDGPCVALATNADATRLVAMEAPLQLENGEVVGSYRVHIWRSK